MLDHTRHGRQRQVASMKRRILVIDDQEDFRTLVATVLTAEGYDVEVTADGLTGLQRAKANLPDAIVLDLMMPQMHGYEVIQHLRATIHTQRVPVVVLSAKAYPSDQRKALEMGATRVLQKPIDPAELIRELKCLLSTTTVTFWGVRGSIAAPGPETARYGGNTPCVTIEHEGAMLVLDAGTGIRKLGLALQGAAAGRAIEVNLLISHTHWDHIQGFPFFLPAFIPRNRIRVFGPRSAEKPLEKVLRGQMDVEYFPVALGDMAANITVEEFHGQSVDFGPFHVTACYLNHPGVTLGYRIEAPGITIAYATDTEPFRSHLPGLVPAASGSGKAPAANGEAIRDFGMRQDSQLLGLIRGADLYIADAQYSPEEYRTKVGWGHTNYLDAVDLACEAGVKRLVLFSHDPMHDDAAVDRKLAQCKQIMAERGTGIEVLAAAESVPISLCASVAAAPVLPATNAVVPGP